MTRTPCIAGLLSFVVLLAGCGSSPSVAPADQLDAYSTAPFADVLAASARDGLVDYAVVAERRDQLDIYLDAVARFGPTASPDQFPTANHELAYYLNAYNALMLKRWLQADAPSNPVGSDVNVLWFMTDQWRVDNRTMSMDYLEQSIIRPEFNEPRIHFALVCGAVSCPPLLGEPFTPDRLDEQLDTIGRRWFQDDDALTVDDDGNVYLSKIFQWYRNDFDAMGGLQAVIERYLPESDPRYQPAIAAAKNGNLRFQPYDWSINTTRAAP